MPGENIYNAASPTTYFYFRKLQLFTALYLPHISKIPKIFPLVGSYGNENLTSSYLFASSHLFPKYWSKAWTVKMEQLILQEGLLKYIMEIKSC